MTMYHTTDRGFVYGEQINPPEVEAGEPCECFVCHECFDLEDDEVRGNIEWIDGEIVCSGCRTAYAKKVFVADLIEAKNQVIAACGELTKAAKKLKVLDYTNAIADFIELEVTLTKEIEEFGGSDGKR